MAFERLPSQAPEILSMILHQCDIFTLRKFCLASKTWYDLANPVLWGNIDFQHLKPEISGFGLQEMQRQWFVTCAELIEKDQDRWKYLSTKVRILKLVKLPSPDFPRQEKRSKDWVCFGDGYNEGHEITIYDVLSGLCNLEELHLYVKIDGMDARRRTTRVYLPFLRLRRLYVGGHILSSFLCSLLSAPASFEELSMLALQDFGVGQDNMPPNMLFLDRVKGKFSRLKRLHLLKQAERPEKPEENGALKRYRSSGLQWPFDREGDESLLKEWGRFLERVSGTLESLTIEDSYLYHGRQWEITSDDENEWEDKDDDYLSSASEVRFQKLLLPIIIKQEWPTLKEMVLIGFSNSMDAADGSLRRFQPRINITCMSAGTLNFEDDVTPMVISPPSGEFENDTGYD